MVPVFGENRSALPGASPSRWSLTFPPTPTPSTPTIDWTPSRLQALWTVLTAVAGNARLGQLSVLAM